MKTNGISGLGKKLLFAMLAVCGGAALVACGTQVNSQSSGYETSQKSDNNSEVSQSSSENSQSTNSSVLSGDKSSSASPATSISKSDDFSSKTESSENVSGESGDSTSQQIAEQLKLYEERIETTLKNKLNAKLDETFVSDIDVKYFSFEQDAKYNTTFFANGNITFVNDAASHSVTLGLPLQGDHFLNVSPLYYTEVVKTNDLAQNYNVDELAAVINYLDDETITFSVAGLDGFKWDINALTLTQIEKKLEQKYENSARETFKNIGNSEYIEGVDFKYFTAVYDDVYGNILKLNGLTNNIYDDKILSFSVSFKVSNENYNLVKNEILTTEYSDDSDLSENYSLSQLNSIVAILDASSTSIAKYTVDDISYPAQNLEKNL